MLLVTILSACAVRTNFKSETNTKINQINIEENLIEDDMPIYNKNNIDLPIDNYFLWRAAKAGDTVYFYATNNLRNNIFYIYNINEKSCIQLDIDILGNIHSIDALGNCLYILVDIKDDAGNSSYTISKYDMDSKSMTSVQLQTIMRGAEVLEIKEFCVVDGQVYANTFDSIYRFDNVGNIAAQIELNNICNGPYRTTTDGILRIYSCTSSDAIIQELDSELQLVCQYTLSGHYNNLFQGVSPDQIFVSDQNSIYSLDLETGDKKPYVNILRYNLSVANFIPLSAESFFTIQAGHPTLWLAGKQGDTDSSRILKCATYNASYELKCAISLFNYNHDDIKIDLIDYSIYDDGITKLIVEMTAGKIPDIFDLSSIPLTGLKSAGYLQNIEDYLLGKGMVPNIMESLKSKDGIFELVPGFQITAMASADFAAHQINTNTLLTLAEKASKKGAICFLNI